MELKRQQLDILRLDKSAADTAHEFAQAVTRALPYVKFHKIEVKKTGRSRLFSCTFDDNKVRMRLPLFSNVGSKRHGSFVGKASIVLHGSKVHGFNPNEQKFIDLLGRSVTRGLRLVSRSRAPIVSMVSVQDSIDVAVAQFLGALTGSSADFEGILKFYRQLSQRSYENRSISYGLVATASKSRVRTHVSFPSGVQDNKRFDAITDGYRTALFLNKYGEIIRLEKIEKKNRGEQRTYRPLWLEPLADFSTDMNLGIALTYQGDIMITWKRSILLSSRNGKWTYWNHRENLSVLRGAIEARYGRPPHNMSTLVERVYRCSLDVSFRRTGGMFFVLNNAADLSLFVDPEDQIRGNRRKPGDRALGDSLRDISLFRIEREVLADLAMLDGAIVCSRNGRLLAYGSVLKMPFPAGLEQIEGARSKAAHSASHKGLVVKISSDGPISVKLNTDTLLKL